MKKVLIMFSFCSLFFGAKAQTTEDAQQIDLQLCANLSWDDTSHPIHRTPPQTPNVYFDAATSTVYFENPCNESILEIIVPGTGTVVCCTKRIVVK